MKQRQISTRASDLITAENHLKDAIAAEANVAEKQAMKTGKFIDIDPNSTIPVGAVQAMLSLMFEEADARNPLPNTGQKTNEQAIGYISAIEDLKLTIKLYLESGDEKMLAVICTITDRC